MFLSSYSPPETPPVPAPSEHGARQRLCSPMFVDSARSHKALLAVAITACVGMLATQMALGGEDIPDPGLGRHSHGPHLHSSLGTAFGSVTSVAAPTGWIRGSEVITHDAGGRGARKIPNAAGGRMVYTGTASWEPTLGIDSKGNIFYQATSFATQPTLVVSRDGGLSWDVVTPPASTHTMDPMIYVDKRTDRVFTTDLTWPCLTVSHSDDVGKSWLTS